MPGQRDCALCFGAATMDEIEAMIWCAAFVVDRYREGVNMNHDQARIARRYAFAAVNQFRSLHTKDQA